MTFLPVRKLYQLTYRMRTYTIMTYQEVALEGGREEGGPWAEDELMHFEMLKSLARI